MREVVAILPNRALYRVNLALYAAYAGDFATAQTEGARAQQMSPLGHLPAGLRPDGQRTAGGGAADLRGLRQGQPAQRLVRGLGARRPGQLLGTVLRGGAHPREGAAADRAAGNPDRAAAKLAAVANAELARGRKDAAIAAAKQALAESQTTKIRFLAGASSPRPARPRRPAPSPRSWPRSSRRSPGPTPSPRGRAGAGRRRSRAGPSPCSARPMACSTPGSAASRSDGPTSRPAPSPRPTRSSTGARPAAARRWRSSWTRSPPSHSTRRSSTTRAGCARAWAPPATPTPTAATWTCAAPPARTRCSTRSAGGSPAAPLLGQRARRHGPSVGKSPSRSSTRRSAGCPGSCRPASGCSPAAAAASPPRSRCTSLPRRAHDRVVVAIVVVAVSVTVDDAGHRPRHGGDQHPRGEVRRGRRSLRAPGTPGRRWPSRRWGRSSSAGCRSRGLGGTAVSPLGAAAPDAFAVSRFRSPGPSVSSAGTPEVPEARGPRNRGPRTPGPRTRGPRSRGLRTRGPRSPGRRTRGPRSRCRARGHRRSQARAEPERAGGGVDHAVAHRLAADRATGADLPQVQGGEVVRAGEGLPGDPVEVRVLCVGAGDLPSAFQSRPAPSRGSPSMRT